MANQNWDKEESMNQEKRQGSENSGNFKNDPERASREGKKGGQASRGRRS